MAIVHRQIPLSNPMDSLFGSFLVTLVTIDNIFSQGDRTKNVGVVDSEYVVHLGLPTLGASVGNKASSSYYIDKSNIFPPSQIKSLTFFFGTCKL